MKRKIARIVAEVLYFLGHLTSAIFVPISATVFYPVYNRFMVWSCAVQDWGGADKPWSKL